MISFLQVWHQNLKYTSPPYELYGPPVSFFSIWSPKIILGEKYRSLSIYARSFFHCPVTLSPLDPNILKHPQSTFLPEHEWLSFTPIQNNKQNYSSGYLNLYRFWLYLVYMHVNNYRCIYITHTTTVSQKIVINRVQLCKLRKFIVIVMGEFVAEQESCFQGSG